MGLGAEDEEDDDDEWGSEDEDVPPPAEEDEGWPAGPDAETRLAADDVDVRRGWAEEPDDDGGRGAELLMVFGVSICGCVLVCVLSPVLPLSLYLGLCSCISVPASRPVGVKSPSVLALSGVG